MSKRTAESFVTMSRTTSVHVEKSKRAEIVFGQTGHQRDDVQALSLDLRGETHNRLVEGVLARKVSDMSQV